MNPTRQQSRVLGLVLIAALAVNLGLGLALGLNRPMESDAYYFQQIAASLSRGDGFAIRDSFWPDAPTMSRMPGWPFAVSLAFRLFPAAPQALLMRALALGVNACAALLIAALTWRLSRSAPVTLVSGLLYGFHPSALIFAYEGLSEPLFVLLAAAGSLPLVSAGEARAGAHRAAAIAGRLIGFLLLGCACLVRANFIAWILFFGVAAGWAWRRDEQWLSRRKAALLASGAVVFILPSFLWALRNERVCGDFPVISSLRGQTFYGGNNVVVARSFAQWGYWVFPDAIPGETPMRRLARRMSEHEIDAYYNTRALRFLRGSPVLVPRLLLGKLIRAYVPVPWKPRPGSILVCLYRALLYAGFLFGVTAAARFRSPAYGNILSAMLLTNLALVLLFYGCMRFSFAIEPFLMPWAGVGALRALGGAARRWSTAGGSEF